jgi:phosphoglycerol transferase MdoB-like AlkP superfamily enzyme
MEGNTENSEHSNLNQGNISQNPVHNTIQTQANISDSERVKEIISTIEQFKKSRQANFSSNKKLSLFFLNQENKNFLERILHKHPESLAHKQLFGKSGTNKS